MSQSLFLEKLCHHTRAFIYGQILIELHANVWCNNILNKFAIQNFKSKVKVTGKTLSCLVPYVN